MLKEVCTLIALSQNLFIFPSFSQMVFSLTGVCVPPFLFFGFFCSSSTMCSGGGFLYATSVFTRIFETDHDRDWERGARVDRPTQSNGAFLSPPQLFPTPCILLARKASSTRACAPDLLCIMDDSWLTLGRTTRLQKRRASSQARFGG